MYDRSDILAVLWTSGEEDEDMCTHWSDHHKTDPRGLMLHHCIAMHLLSYRQNALVILQAKTLCFLILVACMSTYIFLSDGWIIQFRCVIDNLPFEMKMKWLYNIYTSWIFCWCICFNIKRVNKWITIFFGLCDF